MQIVKDAQENFFSISNLAKYLLKHKDFNEYSKYAIERTQAQLNILKHSNFKIQNKIEESVECKFNQLYDLSSANFEP
jgi:hypothetical protein